MFNRPSKDFIWNHYNHLRMDNRNLLRERKELLYAQHPRLKEIESFMTEISLSTNRALLDGTDDPELLLMELRETHNALREERRRLLEGMNLPGNYLDPIYACSFCEDTGYITTAPCVCLKKLETQLRYAGSNLQAVLEKENFDTFRLDYYSDLADGEHPSPREVMGGYLYKCMSFAANFHEIDENLLFVGKPGLGKTFLCHAIAKDLMDNGHSVLYLTASELTDFVRRSKFGFDSGAAAPEELDVLFESDLLIIDDLGTETSSQFSGLVIYEILNKRLAGKKKMVISTNLAVDDLVNNYSERISSRVFGNFEYMEFLGSDIRLKKANID